MHAGQLYRSVNSVKTANNALQRTVLQRGRPVLAMNCVLAGPEMRQWPAVELGR
jgi:hypothetical protein